MAYQTPPYCWLIQILENCPWAIFTFYLLWKNQENNTLLVDSKDIEKKYIISPTLFCEYLSDLSQLKILTYTKSSKQIKIEFLPLEILAEGKTIC